MSAEPKEEPKHLTTEDLAKRYGVKVETAREWLRGKRPKFGYMKPGKEKLVPIAEVIRWEAANLIRGQGGQFVSDAQLLELGERLYQLLVKNGGAK